MTKLFSPLQLGGLTLKNRIAVSPMCQYSAENGVPNDWHFVHLGSRAVGGAALVITEATGVNPEARISPSDTGIWNIEQQKSWERIVKFIHEQGALAGIQLAHAGRKASTGAPWDKAKVVLPEAGGWTPVAPSAMPFDSQSLTPRAMTTDDLERTAKDWIAATQRSLDAGFDIIEVHAAHGYLLHEFLSPLSNQRSDEYGGSLANRMRYPLRIVTEVRKVVSKEKCLFVRISASDWAEGGWDLEQSLVLCRELKKLGVDLVDVSSGGAVPDAKITLGPGYQVPFASAIRKEVNIATGAVGLITTGAQAEEILNGGDADLILLARAELRDAYWPRTAAQELGVNIVGPKQYGRAW